MRCCPKPILQSLSWSGVGGRDHQQLRASIAAPAPVPAVLRQQAGRAIDRPRLCADDLNDDVLGRCLDALFAADVSTLYQVMAEQVVAKLGLKPTAVHLDITSFHVDGAYDCADGEQTGRLQLVRGYSRDHRPELNQVILELISENQAGLPVYLQALSGNSNDNSAFRETVKRHLRSLKSAQESRYLVGDAALYCAETLHLLHHQRQLFITRVPRTLTEARNAVAAIGEAPLTALGDGYQGRWLDADYADVPQRWLLVRSERPTMPSRKRWPSTCWATAPASSGVHKLCARRFACQADAEAELARFANRLKLLEIVQGHVLTEPVYASAGRPKSGQQPDSYQYRIEGQAATCLERVEGGQRPDGRVHPGHQRPERHPDHGRTAGHLQGTANG